MKIAYLVQCHKNAEQLNKLFESLDTEQNDIYVHIDRKAKNLENQITTNERIHIINSDERIDVKWGQISQIDATLKLIESVVSGGKQYDFVYLISGQDFPVKSKKYIDYYLSTHENTAFINIIDVNSNRYKRLLKRNEVYAAQWSVNKSFVMRILRNAWYFITGGRYHTLGLFKRKLNGDTFYFGSQWWCLPFNIVMEMMKYLKANPEFYRFFRHCHCPDESFFQTLLLNHINIEFACKESLTYVNWGDDSNSPTTITINSLNKVDEIIKDNDILFARKFDIETDSRIMTYIAENIDNE